jgi:hypothetical protein
MMDTQRAGKTNYENSAFDSVVEHLKFVISTYLEEKPHMSLGAISKKCSVSEPTLRRIMKGQIKTFPTVTTVLDILTYVSNEKKTSKIISLYPGPIADFLKEMAPYVEDTQTDYSVEINQELKQPVKYLIYKLASNSAGVTRQKVSDLFGAHGLKSLDSLQDKAYIEERAGKYFSTTKSFTSSHENFIENFKTVAEFLKPDKLSPRSRLNPLFRNFSNSVSPEAYEEILKLQKKTMARIAQIMTNEENQGEIPLFLLLAIDTLDTKPPSEF